MIVNEADASHDSSQAKVAEILQNFKTNIVTIFNMYDHPNITLSNTSFPKKAWSK